MAYWDTSCLLKLYAPEADSPVFKAYLLTGVTVVTSEITRMELWAALRRKEVAGELTAGGARLAINQFDADVASGHLTVEALSPAVVSEFDVIIERCYSQAPPLLLQTLDAIHLAAAALAHETEVVATDARLRGAALALKLTVYPPP